MLRKLFSKKKDSPKPPEKNNDGEKILLNSFIEKYKLANVLDSETQDRITECILKGESYIYISSEKIMELDNKLQRQQDFEEKINSTASTNNDGIALEKAGKIELAIKKYEENIKKEYPATHSYERLMILYRKNKEYENEIRVIQTAIKVFTKENKHRLKKALQNANNETTTEAIRRGFESCEQVKGDDGWVIFNPYSVKKYEDRLHKTESLKNKK